jgi:hypothetical protein
MSPWTPNANHKRTNSGKEYGYVPVRRNNNGDPDIIKTYTRVIKNANGVWKVDPNHKFGNFYKTRNGKNFNKITKLYGGFMPIQTTLRWSTLPRNATRRVPYVYNHGPGGPAFNF